VSAGRRLAASSTIPNTRRKLRRRERPDSAVTEALFVIMRLPVTLQWQDVAYSTWRRMDRAISLIEYLPPTRISAKCMTGWQMWDTFMLF
jgi:hypothetical protein